jgi:hypothetical protein
VTNYYLKNFSLKIVICHFESIQMAVAQRALTVVSYPKISLT